MLLKVLDAVGTQQTVISPAQASVVDHSGSITTTGTPQDCLVANAFRSGFVFQNRGANVMYLNDLDDAAVGVSTGNGSYAVQPGEFFPPAGYPVSTGALSVLGTTGEAFILREW